MNQLQFTLVKELDLDGWDIGQVEPAIIQARRSFSGDRFRSITTRRDTYQDRMARQLWIDTFSDNEADKKPGGYREAGGYRVPLMMFEHWQQGPQLRIIARCYYEEAQPLFDHIVGELSGGQVEQEAIELQPARLQTKPQGRRPDPAYDQAFEMIKRGGGTEEAQQEALQWYVNDQQIKDVNQSVIDSFKKAMSRRAEKT